MVMERLDKSDRVGLNIHALQIETAPAASEILWENHFKDERVTKAKSYMLLGLLLFVCVVLVTPMLLA